MLNKQGKALLLAAEAYDPTTGRVLQVSTTEPGIQFYTGNFLDGSEKGKGGQASRPAFCVQPGDAALSRFPERTEISLDRPQSRRALRVHYRVQAFGAPPEEIAAADSGGSGANSATIGKWSEATSASRVRASANFSSRNRRSK